MTAAARSIVPTLCALSLMSVLGCAASHPTRGPQSTPVVLTMRPIDRSQVAPLLVQLSDASVMALWLVADGTLWSQRIDPTTAELLGPTQSTGVEALDDTHPETIALALAAGDLAVLTRMPLGDVALARGSSDPSRRLAARTVLARTPRRPIRFSAAVAGEQIALLAMRGLGRQDGEFSSPIPIPGRDFELHWIGPTGEFVRPLLHWSTHVDVQHVQLGVCGGEHYVVSARGELLTFLTIGARLERSREQILPLPDQRSVSRLGPIVCHANVAWLIASLSRPLAKGQREVAELYATALTPQAATTRARNYVLPANSTWTRGRVLSLTPIDRAGRVSLMVTRSNGGFQVATLDLSDAQARFSPGIVTLESECLPLRGGSGVMCGFMSGDDYTVDAQRASEHMEIVLYGTGAAPDGLEPFENYWSDSDAALSPPPRWQRAPRPPATPCPRR